MADERERIPIGDGQAVYMGPAAEQKCDVHEWPTAGFARRLVKAMKASHPTGINACRDCVSRAREDAGPTPPRSAPPQSGSPPDREDDE